MKVFSDLPLLDSHVHIRQHAEIEPLLELSAEAGAKRIAIMCIPGTPERSLEENAVAFLAKTLYPDRVYVFGSLQYRDGHDDSAAGLRQQAEAMWLMGCDGIKMLEGKPTSRKRVHISLDDSRYDPFYDFMEQTGIPLTSHIADPDTFWDPDRIPPGVRGTHWDYTDGSFPSREQLYAEVDRVLQKYPRLKITFCHFYFLSDEPERAEAFMQKWPNVRFDLTPGSEMYRNFSKKPDFWRSFFIEHHKRLLFGTDNVPPSEPVERSRFNMLDKVRMMRQFLETTGPFEGFCTATSREVIGLGLPASVLPDIYSKNFERFAGPEPRKFDREAAARHAHATLAFARSAPDQAHLAQELSEILKRLAG